MRQALADVNTVGVIINPLAGGNAGVADRAARFAAALGNRGIVIPTSSLAELPDAARRLAQHRIDVLGICGGDGSFFHTLTACIPVFGEHLPYFLPLPAGSMNTIATSLGWQRRDLAQALAHAAR